MKSIDVLNLEWRSFSSRDREAATLVCNYLRFQGLNVVEGSMFNGYHLLKKLKPKVLFITNTTGAYLNQQVTRFAKKLKIPVITTISEGNLRESAIQEMVWGHNNERIPYEDKYLVWSSKSKKLLLKYNKELSNIVKVSGSAGHDKYSILKHFQSTNLNEHKITIGVGCWGFDYYMLQSRDKDKIPQSHKDFFINERDEFNKIFFNIIKKNKDCRFIFKEHPGNLLGHYGSGIESCVSLPNVEVYKNDKTIFDCILESDLWVTYDSTTAMEAWLLGKQTCILNPSKLKWPHQRDQMHLSQPVLNTSKELQSAINAIKSKKIISGFNNFEKKRKEVIREVIEWNDGLNHVRVGNEIIDFLSNNYQCTLIDTRLKLPNIKDVFLQKLKWIIFQNFSFIFKLMKNYKNQILWDENELKTLSKERMKQQLSFYDLLKLDGEKLHKIRSH